MWVRNFVLLQLYLVLVPGLCQQISPLSSPPDWSQLDAFQETMTQDEFVTLLSSAYAPAGAAGPWISIEPGRALIREKATDSLVLRFAPGPASRKTIPRYWKPAAEWKSPPQRPLEGITSALDPGRLGGDWAKLEERWFQ